MGLYCAGTRVATSEPERPASTTVRHTSQNSLIPAAFGYHVTRTTLSASSNDGLSSSTHSIASAFWHNQKQVVKSRYMTTCIRNEHTRRMRMSDQNQSDRHLDSQLQNQEFLCYHELNRKLPTLPARTTSHVSLIAEDYRTLSNMKSISRRNGQHTESHYCASVASTCVVTTVRRNTADSVADATKSSVTHPKNTHRATLQRSPPTVNGSVTSRVMDISVI